MPPARQRRRRPELAERRRALGFSQESLGELIGVAAETVAGWERGIRSPQPRYRPRLAQALQMTVAELNRMIEPDASPIVLDGHAVPVWLNHYESLVDAAGWLGEVEAVAIPALLQVRLYSEAVERATEHVLTDQQIGEAVELRQTRQAALHREADPLHLTAVLPDHLLKAGVGGRQVMCQQLDHLAEIARLPNVELLVLPADARATAMANGFELLARRGHPEPFMAVTLAVDGPHYAEDPDVVRKFLAKFHHLVESALTPSESARRVRDIRESLQ